MTTLGSHLKSARRLAGQSLRKTAEPAGISPAYLQKLEADGVDSPSPRVLFRLAEVLGLSYATLMDLAGYEPIHSGRPRRSAGPVADLLASAELSEDEMSAVAAFVEHLRTQRP